jgi:hypothetical protein
LHEIRSMTSEYSAIYTDDSNDDDMIALAAVFREQIYYLRLPSASSISMHRNYNKTCHPNLYHKAWIVLGCLS